MGIGLFGSSGRSTDAMVRLPEEPDPAKFSIRHSEEAGQFVIARVNYPNCTVYGGDKILVFENTTLGEIESQPLLDPHFTMEGFPPIARFPSNPRGLWMAREFCLMFTEKHGHE